MLITYKQNDETKRGIFNHVWELPAGASIISVDKVLLWKQQ